MSQGDAEFGSLVRRGLGWSFASNVLSRLSTFLVGILLARILEPSQYGEFTVALVVMTLIVNMNDLGLEQTLVRWPGVVTDKLGGTATTLIAGSSILLYGVIYLAAPFVAEALGAPDAVEIVRVLSFGVVINGIFATPSAMLTRSFMQGKRTLADLSGFFIGTIATVVLALLGLGAWAMVWGRLLGNAVVSVLHFTFSPKRFRPGWSNDIAKQLLRSGLPLAGATVLAVGLMNVDYVAVGRQLGATELGYYTLAFNLASWPVTFFAVAVARVAVPAFGRLQGDLNRTQSAYNRSFPLLVAVTGPFCLLIGVFAEPLVVFLYGSKWEPAVPVLRLLAILGLVRVIYQFWTDILIAIGASRRVLASQSVWLTLLVPALYFGVGYGLIGVGVAHLVVAILFVGPCFVVLMRRRIDLGRAVVGPIHTLFALCCGAVAGLFVCAQDWPPMVILLVGAPAVLTIYALANWPVSGLFLTHYRAWRKRNASEPRPTDDLDDLDES